MDIEKEAREIVQHIHEMGMNLIGDYKIMVISEALQTKQDRIEELESALKRLASHEAFVGPRMIDKQMDKELLARIDFAKKAIGGGK